MAECDADLWRMLGGTWVSLNPFFLLKKGDCRELLFGMEAIMIPRY